MKSAKKLPYVLARHEGRWEFWEYLKNKWKLRCLNNIKNIQGNGVIVLPTHLVHNLHLLLHSTNTADFEKLILFQLEAKGLAAAPSSFAYDVLSQKDGKSLLLVTVLETSRCDSKLFKQGAFFEVFPKIFPLEPNTLTLWKEDRLLNIAVTKKSQLVYFQSLTTDDLGKALCAEIRLISLQLRSMDLFPEQHRIVIICGDAVIDNSKIQKMTEQLNCEVKYQCRPSPSLPDSFSNLAPQSLHRERKQSKQRRRLEWIGVAAVAAYLLVIGLVNLHAFALSQDVRRMESEKENFQPQIETIQAAMKLKQELGAAVDPQRSPLHILVQINQTLPSEGVRLLQFDAEESSWSLEGEAQNITLATSFIDKIKKNPAFQNYQWETLQPQISNSLVRFKIKAFFHETAQTQ